MGTEQSGKEIRGPRFEDLTETTGTPISQEAADMMYTRYRLASRFAEGKRVLEVGCGAGQGIGLLSEGSALVVGGDCSITLLRSGRNHYRSRVPLVCLSAERLPFCDAAFDVVLCFEATYYVGDMAAGFRELARVVRPGGHLLLANANPERPDFIRSPHSTHYHSADEFRRALAALGLTVTIEAAFPIEARAAGMRSWIVGSMMRLGRQALERLGLVPRTLRGRARLKRVLLGTMRTVPPELSAGFAHEVEPAPVQTGPVTGFKVLYVTARKSGHA